MSSDNNETNVMMMMSSCASCGVPEVDEIKLKECADCDLVRYCSDECKEHHTAKHEEACKKRAAELRDELLFKQPESNHWGECPICCLPLSLEKQKSFMQACCSKLVCNGCNCANLKRELEERRHPKCSFCREPLPATDEECTKLMMKRVEANDPVAMYEEGFNQFKKGEYISAFHYFTKAAGLGDAAAHYSLALLYRDGHSVEKDKQKEIHHLELAAIGGHPNARHNLGVHEWNNGNTERAVKHWIIAAAQGLDKSINDLMDEFRRGFVRKDDLAAALRAHQAAVDATKSPQREAADKNYRNLEGVHVEGRVEGSHIVDSDG